MHKYSIDLFNLVCLLACSINLNIPTRKKCFRNHIFPVKQQAIGCSSTVCMKCVKQRMALNFFFHFCQNVEVFHCFTHYKFEHFTFFKREQFNFHLPEILGIVVAVVIWDCNHWYFHCCIEPK